MKTLVRAALQLNEDVLKKDLPKNLSYAEAAALLEILDGQIPMKHPKHLIQV